MHVQFGICSDMAYAFSLPMPIAWGYCASLNRGVLSIRCTVPLSLSPFSMLTSSAFTGHIVFIKQTNTNWIKQGNNIVVFIAGMSESWIVNYLKDIKLAALEVMLEDAIVETEAML